MNYNEIDPKYIDPNRFIIGFRRGDSLDNQNEGE